MINDYLSLVTHVEKTCTSAFITHCCTCLPCKKSWNRNVLNKVLPSQSRFSDCARVGRSTISSSYIRQTFKQRLLSLGISNNKMSHTLLVRYYADDGKEKIRTQTLQQFIDVLDGTNQLNFIDCLPHGMFSHETLLTF